MFQCQCTQLLTPYDWNYYNSFISTYSLNNSYLEYFQKYSQTSHFSNKNISVSSYSQHDSMSQYDILTLKYIYKQLQHHSSSSNKVKAGNVNLPSSLSKKQQNFQKQHQLKNIKQQQSELLIKSNNQYQKESKLLLSSYSQQKKQICLSSILMVIFNICSVFIIGYKQNESLSLIWLKCKIQILKGLNIVCGKLLQIRLTQKIILTLNNSSQRLGIFIKTFIQLIVQIGKYSSEAILIQSNNSKQQLSNNIMKQIVYCMAKIPFVSTKLILANTLLFMSKLFLSNYVKIISLEYLNIQLLLDNNIAENNINLETFFQQSHFQSIVLQYLKLVIKTHLVFTVPILLFTILFFIVMKTTKQTARQFIIRNIKENIVATIGTLFGAFVGLLNPSIGMSVGILVGNVFGAFVGGLL